MDVTKHGHALKLALALLLIVAAIMAWQQRSEPAVTDASQSAPAANLAAEPAPPLPEAEMTPPAPLPASPEETEASPEPPAREPGEPRSSPTEPEQELRFGRIPPHIQEIYASYSTDVLEAMGEDGDMAALDTLARRYADANEMGEMQRILIKSAAFGSTEAAVIMGGYLQHSVTDLADSDPATHGQKLLEALSWYEFAARLGEANVDQLRDELLEAYPDRAPDLVQGALARAEALYDELSAERIKRGLPQYEEQGNWQRHQ